MSILTSVTGFPRIGEQRELKKSLEGYWSGKGSLGELEGLSSQLRERHWGYQKDAGIDFISSNDFSWYDLMLDTMVMVGAVPYRFRKIGDPVERYFAMARGNWECVAMEMTKWFNSNYHYLVPELSGEDTFKLDAGKIVKEYKQAKEAGVKTKINVIGPVTFLQLARRVDGGDTLELLDKLLPVYDELVGVISGLDDEVVVQWDEPWFVKDPSAAELDALKKVYSRLPGLAKNVKMVVTTYFEHSNEASKVLAETDVWGVGLDFVHGEKNFDALKSLKGKVVFAGVVDGRNIWKTDADKAVALLEKVAGVVGKDNIVVSSSCSLLHVPYSLKYEEVLDDEIKGWLSFALEKLDEIAVIAKVFGGDGLSSADKAVLDGMTGAAEGRKKSSRIHNVDVQERVKRLEGKERDGRYEERIVVQKEELGYPTLATTTIGSFPQTPELRRMRLDYKKGRMSKEIYEVGIKGYIDDCIAFQEDAGLDVLVHGEPERNDMVEYFGQMMEGFAFTSNGWVQSYGSRCVKPPIIYGDVSRDTPMTVDWICYAQRQTAKIVKGMLTGPVTILNWSFVRDDLARNLVSDQIAVALCDEVDDLQEAGIRMIQVDEAAFKEGYPLRKENVKQYENWAVNGFKLAVSSAWKETQIHTHMCYSDFNDIIKTIEAMDADVISIETARSGNELLKVFKKVGYRQEVGPGVYDIHSPRVPSVDEMVVQIKKLLEVLPAKQLWINPDCGLKTRKWDEVKPSLVNMVEAVKQVRENI